ncbi:MAG: SAM-dependent methyltransferase [Spirochaetes bacterium]|nr:SAM-dependent methyltransferase [Spirochaetota bacterium]
MVEKTTSESIADSSKPNAGRIYDYLLGGNHNFEVDRMAAQKLLQLAPFTPQLFRTIRWFLGEAVRRLAADGYTRFIDFASGLPTMDHIHQIAPPGTRVIYSDLDPVTVAYGQEILKDHPDARYLACPAGKPETLLASPVVTQLFGENRKVAIGFNGIAWFLPDEEITHAMQSLHAWAAPGSRLFIADIDNTSSTPELTHLLAIYEKLGQPFHLRTLRWLQKLIAPWKVREPGFKPLEEWLEMKKTVAEKTEEFGGLFMGAILEK